MTIRTTTAISSLGYLVVTFPLAIFWHLVLFKNQYEDIGYIGRDQPIFLFGFLSILIQGILLSIGYRLFCKGNYSVTSGIRYSLFVGLFFWTSHVMAFAAKGDIHNLALFFPLETIYLIFQFGIYGVITGYFCSKSG